MEIPKPRLQIPGKFKGINLSLSFLGPSLGFGNWGLGFPALAGSVSKMPDAREDHCHLPFVRTFEKSSAGIVMTMHDQSFPLIKWLSATLKFTRRYYLNCHFSVFATMHSDQRIQMKRNDQPTRREQLVFRC